MKATAATLLERAIAGSGLPRSTVAARADLAPSTVHRIGKGRVDPGVGTLAELMAALGYALDLAIEPLSDPSASRAARTLLDEHFPVSSDVGVDTWARRLERWGMGDPVRTMVEAGRAASLLHRREAIGMKGACTLGRLASAGDASGSDWAVSGAAGLARHEFNDTAPTGTVLRCASAKATADLLTGKQLRITQVVSAATIILVDSEPADLVGGYTDDQIRYAAPVQIMLDCLGLDSAVAGAARAAILDW